MRTNTYRWQTPLCALIACLFFLSAGLALIPHAGIEDDEALFAEAIYQPRAELFAIHLGRSHVPLMLMNYLGALKSLIYKPILLIFGSGLYALRVPMLLAGAASVWLFFLLIRRIAGPRAALIGCCLLAVDSSYLTTVCFDWGPVALQHLLMLGGGLLAVRFYQERENWTLAASGLLFGLALWDKALAVWMLSGMAVAGISTLGRQVFGMVTGRRVALAVLAFLVGALPLLVYNAESHWETFHGNFTRDFKDLPGKAQFLLNTEKKGVFGWLTARDWQTPQPQSPDGPVESMAARISALAGNPHDFPLLYAFVAALVAAPLAGRGGIRAILFSLIALAVAWIQMATNASTGGSVHHTILLWPLPELIIAISFAAASRRAGRAGMAALAAAMAVMVACGALVINQYYVELWRYGGAQAWNNGIFALSDYVKGLGAQNVVCMDWGLIGPLRLLGRGKLPLISGSDAVSKPEMSDEDRRTALWLLSEPGNVYIGHTKEFAFFPLPGPNLLRFAEESGYRRTMLAVISDPYGRRVFEVYRFEAERAQDSPSPASSAFSNPTAKSSPPVHANALSLGLPPRRSPFLRFSAVKSGLLERQPDTADHDPQLALVH